MKRDMDLVREILIAVESRESAGQASDFLTIPGHDEREVAAHVQIMVDAGLVEAAIFDSQQEDDPLGAIVSRLTWKGHDFLENSRDSKLWAKAKSVLAEKGVGMTIDALMFALKDLAQRALRGELSFS